MDVPFIGKFGALDSGEKPIATILNKEGGHRRRNTKEIRLAKKTMEYFETTYCDARPTLLETCLYH